MLRLREQRRSDIFAGAAGVVLCSTLSVGRKLSRVHAAFTESCTTKGRRPSGQPRTTASTCPTRTPEEGTNAPVALRADTVCSFSDVGGASDATSGLCSRVSTNLSRLNSVLITFVSLVLLPRPTS